MACYLHGDTFRASSACAASPPSPPCCRRGRQLAWTEKGLSQRAPAPARLAELRLDSISPCLFLLHRQAQPAGAPPGRQAGTPAHPPPAPRPQRARGPWLPARLQCPPPLRVPSPAAPPALARRLPASAPRSRLCPDLLPLLPLRREACRAASAPPSSAGATGACGEESGAAPGRLPPPPGCLAAPAILRQEGRKEVLNHRPGSFPGPAPQVAKARARTQPCCNPIPHGPVPPGTFWTKMKPCAFLPRRGGYGST